MGGPTSILFGPCSWWRRQRRLSQGCHAPARVEHVPVEFGNTVGYTGGIKISVSLLDGLVKEADAVARKLKVSRSTLIQTALREFLNRGRDEKVTAALNRSLAKHPHEIDPFLQQLVVEAMKRIEWKE